MIGKPSHGSTVNHPVVASETYVDHLALDKLAITVLGECLELAYGDYADLRGQNQGAGKSSTDGSDVRKANSATHQLFRSQLCLFGQVSQSFELLLDVS